jgi:hypothetical protein
MVKTVYFYVQGQFGNNLFQYFAAEIIKKIYDYDEVKPVFDLNMDFVYTIDDEKFKQIITTYINKDKYELESRKDILMIGFFQRSEILKYEREYVRKLFNVDNKNYINNRIQICNIVKYISKHTVKPTSNDLTVHLRCGDFWDHEKNRSQIFDPNDIKNLINMISHDKLYIVYSKPAFDWEKEYYKEFECLNPIWINGNMGDDFDFIMSSKKVILSASTYSYIASYLGDAYEIHIPYNSYYGGIEGNEQHLADFNDKCKVYYDLKYWLPFK